jgi:S1-C subfamily serine protease
MESQARAITYPEQINVPMSCPAIRAANLTSPPAPILGLQVRGLSRIEGLAAGLGDRGAVLVTSVTDNGRAAMAGLNRGDIILSIGERELKDPAMMEESVRATTEAPLALTIWRSGVTQILVLTPGKATP